MKIVKEHLNEIKQDIEGSGLGALGVGKSAVLRKLKTFLHEHTNYSHLLHNDAKGNRVSKMLNLPIEDILHFGVVLDITETILYFDQCDKTSSSYNKDYWIYSNPNFVIEHATWNDETVLYVDKTIYND